ncbi:protein wntless [Plodia interpunctella]|uniref:protein wntless n=1 Tax=Plodia interpunctella TaxID=58824 RepID=UPI0023676346|nr:protein wntless [Plodia interpunctella]
MSGTIIENLSGRKLAVLVSFLLLCQLTCFLIGGLVAPMPASFQNILATVCKDTSTVKNDTTKWFYNRGKGSCKTVDLANLDPDISEIDIVFAFQMPVPRESKILDYSRWQQNLIGVLQIDIAYNSQMEVKPRSVVTIDARLAYQNKGDPEDEWKLYTQSIEKRHLDCDIDVKADGYLHNCAPMPLFELGSLFHDYYLLNVRLPVDEPDMNTNLGHIQDMWLTVINQNGGFTKVWVSLKTVFFPCIVAILVWFWRRIHMLERKPVLLEKMLLSLGIAVCVLNMPLEYLTLHYDLPFMLLLGDMRQGIFYAMLFSFWLVFAGEHMLIQEASAQSSLKQYWRHLSAVAIGCTSLFIFDMCERGVQLRNPFYSIWVTDIGTNLALTFIILAGICTGVYFLFLCYLVWQVFKNISQKRQSLPTMSSVRRLHYEGIIYRFKFLMLATLLCAALTVIGFILGQVAEGQWKWDENIKLEYTSAFFTGVYGMWNIYIFALLVLYAPSHKHWPVNENTSDTQNLSEEIEFNRLPTERSEISSLMSFIRKPTTD